MFDNIQDEFVEKRYEDRFDSTCKAIEGYAWSEVQSVVQDTAIAQAIKLYNVETRDYLRVQLRHKVNLNNFCVTMLNRHSMHTL